MKASPKDWIPQEFLAPSKGFSAAMDAMDIYWWYWDNVRKVLTLNPALREILGYGEAEFDGTIPTLNKNIHPDDFEKNSLLWKRLVSGETDSYEIEFRVRIDDQWQWFYNRGTAISRDESGTVVIAGGVTVNISGKYEHILSRIEESKKFEFIFQNTNEAVLVVAMGNEHNVGKIIDVNQAACDLFALSEDELIRRDPFEFLDAPIKSSRQELQKELREKGTISIDIEIVDRKARRKFIKVKTSSFTLTGQDLFIAILQDVTESREIKKELEDSINEFRGKESIYQQLIQAANDRIGLFDTEGNPILVNNAFTEVLGYSPDEDIDLSSIERVHPDDQQYLQSRRSEIYKTGYLSTEYRAKHKDGHYLHMSSKSVLLKDPDLAREYVLFIVRDISSEKEFQRELIRAKEKAEESDQLKSAFLANMSHEIRTPMNSIVGFANLLSDPALDEASRQEYVNRINRNSSQLLALISDIIDLAKIESNQLAISYTNVSVSNLFHDLENYGEVQLANRPEGAINMVYEPDSDNIGLTIETDLVRLTQIMQNLLNNAVKFTKEGEIRFGYEVHDKLIRFFVKDTGIGIDPKNFKLIFDQFRQVDGSHTRKFGGTGLGLAICKNLSELLNGRIWVESEQGSGSQFFLEIPLKSGYLLRDHDKEKSYTKSTDNESIRVMMVDDDPDSLMLVSTLLRMENFQVITADSGYNALELLERERLPDIILLDLQMPVLNGEQTLRIIKEKYPDIKVIAQSAHALEGDKERTHKMGFDAYISKPFNKHDLIALIRGSV